MATLPERRPTDQSVDSRTVAIGPGSVRVEAFFGDKKLSIRRERYAENLFRSIGLGAAGMLAGGRTIREGMEYWDPEVAASIDAHGAAFRTGKAGAKWTLSKAVAHHNVVVSNNTQAIAESHARQRLDRKSRHDDKQTEPAFDGKAPLVDSKALASEIESVAAQLRGLMAGMDSDNLSAMNPTGGNDEAQEDDEDEGTGLHARLLRYRYVRKIEAPVPPLEPLEDSHALGPRRTDMMDRNLQAPRILWTRKTQERAAHWNRETSERIESARSRRQEALEELATRLEVGLGEKERKIERVEAMRTQQVERLRAKAASREERVEQVKLRQEEERLDMEQRLRDGLPLRARSREREQSPPAVKRQSSPRAAPKRVQGIEEGTGSQMAEASEEIPHDSAQDAAASEPPAAGSPSTDEDKAAEAGEADDWFDWFDAAKEE
eukprot:TRINITY_DN4355_c0_g1_i1.p1 TRINITY_DN4355_c0_g1~~TRINITY_DN4355_c0_g1_i1.p1  ORF type:complete len:435 (+),score=88.36 TRINITY_DN4355_c0_g1_i1:86-1390(+)